MFVSCLSKKGGQVWTDRPEVFLLVELFNASREDRQLEVHYEKDLSGVASGLLIGTDFGFGIARKFQELDSLLEEESFQSPLSRISPSLLAPGQRLQRTYLLPLSYSLLGVVFRKDRELSRKETHLLSIGELRSNASNFDKEKKGKIIQMGFSPLWSPRLLRMLAEFYRVDISSGGRLATKSRGFPSFLTFLRGWVAEGQPDPAAQRNFSETYRTIPDVELVRAGRILFAVLTEGEFMNIPAPYRDELTFLPLSYQRQILVANLLLAGIAKKSRATKEIRDFLQWVLDPGNQEKYLQEKVRLKSEGYGFLGGRSSLSQINRGALAELYPAVSFVLGTPDRTISRILPPPPLDRKWLLLLEQMLWGATSPEEDFS